MANFPSQGDSSEQSSAPSSDKQSSDKKLSELTMLGVEQMLRRSERGDDRSRSWWWWVGVVVLLAALGGLGVGLYRHAGSLSAVPQTAEELTYEWVIYPISDAVAPDDRFSIQGLQLAIESAGWRPQGQQGVVESPGARQVRQTYRYKHHRIDAVLYDLSDRAEARRLVDRTTLPARAVRCDTKVVVLESATPNQADPSWAGRTRADQIGAEQVEEDYLEGLALLIEDYREAVLAAPGTASP